VPTIISVMPLVLQVALALSFAGLLVLLWSLQTLVASTVSVLVRVSHPNITSTWNTIHLPNLRHPIPVQVLIVPIPVVHSLFVASWAGRSDHKLGGRRPLGD
jgi:hypothetical protein